MFGRGINNDVSEVAPPRTPKRDRVRALQDGGTGQTLSTFCNKNVNVLDKSEVSCLAFLRVLTSLCRPQTSKEELFYSRCKGKVRPKKMPPSTAMVLVAKGLINPFQVMVSYGEMISHSNFLIC